MILAFYLGSLTLAACNQVKPVHHQSQPGLQSRSLSTPLTMGAISVAIKQVISQSKMPHRIISSAIIQSFIPALNAIQEQKHSYPSNKLLLRL